MTDARLDATYLASLTQGSPESRIDAAYLASLTPSTLATVPGSLPGRVLWLRAKDVATGATTAWDDVGGLANHFTSTGGNPTCVAGATPIGGKAIRFAADSAMQLTTPVYPQIVSASSSYPTEQPINAIDTLTTTYWTTNGVVAATFQVQWRLGPRVVTGYKITRRDDLPNRNPKDWTLQASNDALNWTTLDTQTGITWPTAGEVKSFSFSNSTAYLFYRINITANNGDVQYTSMAGFLLTPSVAAEMWVVIKWMAAGTNASWQFGQTTNGSCYLYNPDGKIYESFGEGGNDRESWTPTLSVASWRLYRVVNDGTTWQAWLDSTSQLTVANKPVLWYNPSAWTIGISPGASGVNRLNAQVAEMFLRDRVSTPSEVTDLITYFNAEHGLTVPGGAVSGGYWGIPVS